MTTSLMGVGYGLVGFLLYAWQVKQAEYHRRLGRPVEFDEEAWALVWVICWPFIVWAALVYKFAGVISRAGIWLGRRL
jgi:hypothetical protein